MVPNCSETRYSVAHFVGLETTHQVTPTEVFSQTQKVILALNKQRDSAKMIFLYVQLMARVDAGVTKEPSFAFFDKNLCQNFF